MHRKRLPRQATSIGVLRQSSNPQPRLPALPGPQANHRGDGALQLDDVEVGEGGEEEGEFVLEMGGGDVVGEVV